MGSLSTHPIASLVGEYALTAFVETGLYKGEGLTFAAKLPFKRLVSIDILQQWVDKGKETFKGDARVELLQGNSFDVMPEALELVKGHRVLWWLDAHLPEACIDNKMEFTGNKIFNDEMTFPLQGELETIAKERDISGDVFLIDDLRIYEDGDYTWGNWKTKGNYNDPGDISFVSTLLGKTHTIEKGTKDHGFLRAMPFS